MNKDNQIYIELLFSAYKSSGFFKERIPHNFFKQYPTIKNAHKEIIESLKDEYDGIAKSYFDKNINLKDKRDELIDKILSLENILRRTEAISANEKFYKNISEKTFYPAFDFFCRKTGQVRSKPFNTYKLSESDFREVEGFVEKIGRDIIQLELLNEIDDYLKFADNYSMHAFKKKVKKGVADACWEIYKRNNDITKNELLKAVEQEYHIKKYKNCSPKKASSKKRKNALQWIRDVKVNNNIKIPD